MMNQWARRAAWATVFAILPLATGCNGFFVYPGSSTGSTSGTDYVYVANATAGTLAGFAVGTGTLTAVSGSPYTLGFTPSAVVVNPADTIVFVAGTSGGLGYIAAYSIGSSGALTLLTNNAVGVASEVAMDVSPNGDWLLGLDTSGQALGSAVVDEYSINASTGALTLGTGASYNVSSASLSPAPGAVVPSGIKIAPGGGLVFVALGTAGTMDFTFNQSSTSGLLTASQTAFLASGGGLADNALTVSPNGNYLYVARSGTNGGIAAYTISGSSGVLASVSGTPLAAGTQPYSVVVNSAGTDVYVANRTSGTISGYSVSSNGTLAALGQSPYNSGNSVTALAIDKTGDYLLAAAYGGSPDVWLYSFDSSVAGKLDLSNTYSTGSDPTNPVAIAATH
jgi:6-phosphogluconolactonase (cycloisomerase 2 family)